MRGRPEAVGWAEADAVCTPAAAGSAAPAPPPRGAHAVLRFARLLVGEHRRRQRHGGGGAAIRRSRRVASAKASPSAGAVVDAGHDRAEILDRLAGRRTAGERRQRRLHRLSTGADPGESRRAPPGFPRSPGLRTPARSQRARRTRTGRQARFRRGWRTAPCGLASGARRSFASFSIWRQRATFFRCWSNESAKTWPPVPSATK